MEEEDWTGVLGAGCDACEIDRELETNVDTEARAQAAVLRALDCAVPPDLSQPQLLLLSLLPAPQREALQRMLERYFADAPLEALCRELRSWPLRVDVDSLLRELPEERVVSEELTQGGEGEVSCGDLVLRLRREPPALLHMRLK